MMGARLTHSAGAGYEPTVLERHKHLFLLIPSTIALIIPLVATISHGVGIYPDSVKYIGIARNLASGQGLVSYDGAYTARWPPLYPALLGLIGFVTGLDPYRVAGPLNAILQGLNVYLAGLLAFKVLPSSPNLAIAGCMALAFAIPLNLISVIALSEPLFILLTLISFHVACQLFQRANLPLLLCLAFASALAALTRYIGVILIVWGTFTIITLLPGKPGYRLKQTLIFALTASLPIVVLFFANFLLTGRFTGNPDPSEYSFPDNVAWTFRTVGGWYFTDRLFPVSQVGALLSSSYILSGLLMFLALLATVAALFRYSKRGFRQNTALTLLVFVAAYTCFLIFLATRTRFDTIDHRLLSPICIPLTILFLAAIARLRAGLQRHGRNTMSISLLSIAFAFGILYPLLATAKRTGEILRDGIGYSNPEWTESPTIAEVRKNLSRYEAATVYTNSTDALYILTKVKAGFIERDFTSIPPHTGPGTIIIWFDAFSRVDETQFSSLQDSGHLILLSDHEDGAIYLVQEFDAEVPENPA